jgi:hypothetical protein
MDKPISVGDLVMVVRPNPCGCSHSVGNIFTVDHIEGGPNYCASCGERFADVLDAWQDGLGWAARVVCLKRIPPYSQLEHFRTEELLRRDVKEKA